MKMSSHRARKSLGQNFLMHAHIASRIALVAGISGGSIVLEIGPGHGILTRELLGRARKVIAVEADRLLYEELQNSFAREILQKRLVLVYGDIRSFDISKLPKGYSLVANIPYYLTGEIFRMFLSAKNQPNSMTLLVQKEVAERIASRLRPRQVRKENILSLSVKVYGTPKYEFTVPRGSFSPSPKVDSAVLSVRGISRKNFSSRRKENLFFALLHAGFTHKRKFVRSNLAKIGVSTGKIPIRARAEDLSLSDWLAINKTRI